MSKCAREIGTRGEDLQIADARSPYALVNCFGLPPGLGRRWPLSPPVRAHIRRQRAVCTGPGPRTPSLRCWESR